MDAARPNRVAGAVGETDLLEHLERVFLRAPDRAFAPRPEQARHGDVLQHAESGEGADDLEGAGDAETIHPVRSEAVDAPAPEPDFAGARP